VLTTDSAHQWRVYPNLARRMVVGAINQLWVADITYIRLQQEFIYLAVILDVYSRRVVGWSISRQLDGRVAQQALESALKERQPAPGLIHHSDRGVQYASGDYVKRLEAAGIMISMSRPGNPYDNAWAESFMKTLKVEEVDGRRYRNFDHAASRIGSFIEELYNEKRLHSALDYLSPVEFEAEVAGQSVKARISTKKEKRSKKERKARKGRPVETAAAMEIQKRRPSANSS
jgi:putative transposase